MSLRARFGFKDDGTPQSRIVVAGADIDAATLAQIVFDADFAAVRVAYAGFITNPGGAYLDLGPVASWPDMGFIPFCMVAAWSEEFGFYDGYFQDTPANGPYGPYASGDAIMQCAFLDEVPQGGCLNSVIGVVTSAGLDGTVTFSFDEGVFSYVVFAFPTG